MGIFEEINKQTITDDDSITQLFFDFNFYFDYFNHYSYLITWHGAKIYISGDTEHIETLAEQRDLDWVFLPAWLVMDGVRKETKYSEISKMYAVYHIGPLDKIDIRGERFIMLDHQGNIIHIPFR